MISGMLGTTPPCQGTKNRAFIDPGNSDRFKIAAAEKICESCPLLKQCALAGLTAGNLPDGTKSVSDEVIVAGVVCQGDQDTVDALNAVANAPEATHSPHAREVQPRALITPGQPCKACSRPLWKWTRDQAEIPEGYVIHHARGWCKHCRGAYKQATAHTPKRQTRERQRRPRHCIQCQHPMVPMSHDLPTDSHVHHMARGRCIACSRPERLTATQLPA